MAHVAHMACKEEIMGEQGRQQGSPTDLPGSAMHGPHETEANQMLEPTPGAVRLAWIVRLSIA